MKMSKRTETLINYIDEFKRLTDKIGDTIDASMIESDYYEEVEPYFVAIREVETRLTNFVAASMRQNLSKHQYKGV